MSVDVQSFHDHLSKILKDNLLPDKKQNNPGMKVIHDPLWGSRLFYPWEIALIDTPLCQRLRQIYQLGTAFLTYPSAIHNRFSHSLGVATLAGRLIVRLKEKAEILSDSTIKIGLKEIYTVRLAGLLHDIGHCFFSHLSEKILDPLIRDLRRELVESKPKPHEFIGYLIITNKYFNEYWNEKIAPLIPDESLRPDLEDVAKMIIKIPPSKEKRYLQEIISGAYDVDKLEYLYRDARTAGLEISYDIERYFYKIRVVETPRGGFRLVMGQGGISAIEQIIFSKMMLFSFVYHHQKVLASDALIADLILEIIENYDENTRFNIEHPFDLLLYTDFDLLANVTQDTSDRFNQIRKRLINRELPKRCFVINKEFVNDLNGDESISDQWDRLNQDLRSDPKIIKKIREEIAQKVRDETDLSNFTVDDIFVTLPKAPSIKEAAQGPVFGTNGSLGAISDFFKLEGWKSTYDLKKLKGYFYTFEDDKYKISEIIEKYLFEKYSLSFSENSKIEAKIN